MRKKPDIYAVIMAGGGGTRFWPWSREKRPKQVLPIFSPRAMIRETVERIQPLVPPERILIVTARSQADQLHREIPRVPRENLLLEPRGKNTAPCLCLAAVYAQKVAPEAVLIVLPADHFIGNRAEFLRTLERAAEFARREDFLVTLGIPPSGPETGYGYIQRGPLLAHFRGTKIFKARGFREKPDLPKARGYLRRGDYLWNSGMFLWRAEVFLEAAKTFLPSLHRDMQGLKAALGTRREKKDLERVYSRCLSISVDYGIMEKASNVALIEARFGWSDVGSWSALGTICPSDPEGNVRIQKDKKGKIVTIDSSGCVIRGEKNLIAVLGLKDIVVAQAGDAILVCPRDRSQDVRRILQELKQRGWRKYL